MGVGVVVGVWKCTKALCVKNDRMTFSLITGD